MRRRACGLLAAATLLAIDFGIQYAGARSKRVNDLMGGSPVLVGRDGVIYEDVLRRERVPRTDVEKALRAADCEIEDMRMAILEADGSINIMKQPE